MRFIEEREESTIVGNQRRVNTAGVSERIYRDWANDWQALLLAIKQGHVGLWRSERLVSSMPTSASWQTSWQGSNP